MIADETLNHWADRFIDARLAEAMSFEQFLTLSPALRERRITQHREVRHLQGALERDLPDAAMHGDRLIDPLHHQAPRPWRRPSFFRRRRHAQESP